MVRKAATTNETDLVAAATEVFSGDIAAIDGVYTDANGEPMSLVSRIAMIIHGLPDVQPEGTNTYFRYKFITDKQVNGLLRPRLSQQHIVIVPELVEEEEMVLLTTGKGGTSYMTRLRVMWRVMDGITGETFTGQSKGYGDDGGDKGANKAFTAAFKNFLIKLFMLGGESDIEEDEQVDKRAAARDSAAPKVEKAVIGESKIEDVERGGKSKTATEAQVARVGQYVRDLQLDAAAFAALLKRQFDITITLGETPWEDVKNALNSMDGLVIGKLITELDALYNAPDNAPIIDGDGA